MEIPAIITVLMGGGFFVLSMLWRHAYEDMCIENKRLRKKIGILYKIKAPIDVDVNDPDWFEKSIKRKKRN